MEPPEEYIVQKFYQLAGYPKFVKSTNTYMGGCPICREGKSWGRKSRLYYIPKDGVICCHNCGWYGGTIKWIMEAASMNYNEVMDEISRGDFNYGIPKEPTRDMVVTDLPKDSINLFDKTQLSYYINEEIVKKAASMLVDRRLNTAVNRPKSIYISLLDYVHKNRLVIPFNDRNGKCIFYQTRTIVETSPPRPKYLSKMNSDKTLFNYDNLKTSSDHIFITEGPIDSFFIKNSVAVAGIQQKSKESLTLAQKSQLDKMWLTTKVWVLDSQYSDHTSRIKSEKLLEQGECVFIWPESLGKRFKDVNEVCVNFSIDEITNKFILDNTYCGLRGLVKIKQIK